MELQVEQVVQALETVASHPWFHSAAFGLCAFLATVVVKKVYGGLFGGKKKAVVAAVPQKMGMLAQHIVFEIGQGKKSVVASGRFLGHTMYGPVLASPRRKEVIHIGGKNVRDLLKDHEIKAIREAVVARAKVEEARARNERLLGAYQALGMLTPAPAQPKSFASLVAGAASGVKV